MHMTGSDSYQKTSLAAAAIELWQGELGSLQHISDSANQVFIFRSAGGNRFLRLTCSIHRTRSQIEAELDFIAYLQGNGVNVSLPVASTSGRMLEEIPADGVSFFACVFEEAVGETFVFDTSESNLGHFRLRGQTLGQMHALAKAYTPPENKYRLLWYEDDLFRNAEDYLPQSETVVWHEYREIREWLFAHPQDGDSFGLIHGDFGPTNFRHSGGKLTVFDFDDSCYHWFAYDLSVTIYPHGRRTDANALLDALLEGYSEMAAASLPTKTELIQFCRLRQLYMFLNYAKVWGLTDLSDGQIEWFKQKRDNIARGYRLSE